MHILICLVVIVEWENCVKVPDNKNTGQHSVGRIQKKLIMTEVVLSPQLYDGDYCRQHIHTPICVSAVNPCTNLNVCCLYALQLSI